MNAFDRVEKCLSEGVGNARGYCYGWGLLIGLALLQPTVAIGEEPVGGRFDLPFDSAGHVVSDGGGVVNDGDAAVTPGFDEPAEQPEEQPEIDRPEGPGLQDWVFTNPFVAADGVSTACITDRCCPFWTAQVDALMLWQGNIPSRPLYADSASGATALDVRELQNIAAIAPRYSITYHRDECRALEINYFQMWGFNASRTIGPSNGGYEMKNLLGLDYNAIDVATAESSANIKSLEFNLRRSDGGSIRWISGFRWLEWGQQLGIGDTSAGTGTYNLIGVSTLNNLYGWQWGGDMMLWNGGRWLRINGVGKAGVYYNHQALQNTFYSDGVAPDVALAKTVDTVSFVGETGLNASLSVTNWLALRAGYSCFWLGGVVTPAAQLGLTDLAAGTTSINRNGSVLLHGATIGLEARW